MVERPILFSGPLVRAILDGRKTQTRRLATDLRIVPRRKVTADPMPGQRVGDLVAVAPPHRYRAGIGRAGAVSAELDDEEGRLGLKPGEFDFVCPYADGRTYLDEGRWHIDVAPDQQLWVREAWRTGSSLDSLSATAIAEKCIDAGYPKPWTPTQYVADEHERDWQMLRDFGGTWGRYRHARFMPRWASRLNLAVEHVRLERLQDITEGDALAEGVEADTSACDHTRVTCAEARCLGPGHRSAFAGLWDSINGDRATWASNPWVWAVTFRRIDRSAS